MTLRMRLLLAFASVVGIALEADYLLVVRTHQAFLEESRERALALTDLHWLAGSSRSSNPARPRISSGRR
jgi:hypothetical protein